MALLTVEGGPVQQLDPLVDVRGPVEEVAARLDDSHKRDQDQGQQLKHGPNLPDPGGHVVVAIWTTTTGGGWAPVKHLLEAARLE